MEEKRLQANPNTDGGKEQKDSMEAVNISRPLLKRLPVYLEHLKSLPEEDKNISATTIARSLGLGHVLVRKDLAKISDGGRCRTGRSRQKLIRDIEGYLDSYVQSQDWT